MIVTPFELHKCKSPSVEKEVMDRKISAILEKPEIPRHELWAKIELLIKSKARGIRNAPGYKSSSCRSYRIPSESGGYLTLVVQVNAKYCRISVDRWATVNYNDAVSEAWFRENIWPVVLEGLSQMTRNEYSIMPTGGSQATAWPIPRNRIVEVLASWLEAEKVIGI